MLQFRFPRAAALLHKHPRGGRISPTNGTLGTHLAARLYVAHSGWMLPPVALAGADSIPLDGSIGMIKRLETTKLPMYHSPTLRIGTDSGCAAWQLPVESCGELQVLGWAPAMKVVQQRRGSDSWIVPWKACDRRWLELRK
jgi:hypothetical protein